MTDCLVEKYVIAQGLDGMWGVAYEGKELNKFEYIGEAIEWLFFEKEVAQLTSNTSSITIEIAMNDKTGDAT